MVGDQVSNRTRGGGKEETEPHARKKPYQRMLDAPRNGSAKRATVRRMSGTHSGENPYRMTNWGEPPQNWRRDAYMQS